MFRTQQWVGNIGKWGPWQAKKGFLDETTKSNYCINYSVDTAFEITP